MVGTTEPGDIIAGIDHRAAFRKDLTALLNRYSKENDSNTPDYILADYVLNCMSAYNLSVQRRDIWNGSDTPEEKTK